MDGYLRINKIDYDVWHTYCKGNTYYVEPGEAVNKINVKINLICNDKINDIGEDQFALSLNWYNKRSESESPDLRKLQNNLRTFFENRCKGSKAGDNLFTTYKGFETMLDRKGYSAKNCFCAFNTRATNEYRERKNVAFMINRFMAPVEKRFYETHGVVVKEENIALNEMIQFVWRSAVRDGNQINLYIPSKRMRDMFIEWHDSINEVPIDRFGERQKFFFKQGEN